MVQNLEKINAIKRDMVAAICDAAKNHYRIKRVIIFGSSVRNNCREDSDIDICIEIEGTTEGMDLFLFQAEFAQKCDFNYDLLFYHYLSGKIKEIIDQTGVIVYVRIE